MLNKSGKVFVNGDEWTTTNAGFQKAPDVRVFTQNLAAWFSGGKPGKFLVYSTNFSLTQSSFHAALKEAGHTVTTDINAKFTLETLLTYDGVFLSGNAADNNILIEYVKNGGSVYLSAGTGVGGADGETGQWKTFLNAVGLKLEPVYDGFVGNFAVQDDHDHPVLRGVKHLYCCGANPVVDIDPESPANKLAATSPQGKGLLAWFNTSFLPEKVVVTDIFFDGKVKAVESDEFIEIANQGFSHVDLSGWKVTADDSKQEFSFPAGTLLRSGQSIRIYTNAVHPETGGFSFGIKRAVWNNKTDEGKLLNAEGKEVSSRRYTAEPKTPARK